MKAVNLEKLLPADIPEGERILWHGRPRWMSLARRAYRADFIAAYFVALTIWSVWSAADSGWSAAALAGVKTLGTRRGGARDRRGARLPLRAHHALRRDLTKRLVLKVGIALPIFINIPFKDIGSASARVYGDGTGDIPVALEKGRRIGYWLLWPSARPLHLPQAAALPALRRRRRGRRRDASGRPFGTPPGSRPRLRRSRNKGRARRRGADARRPGCGVEEHAMTDLAVRRQTHGMPREVLIFAAALIAIVIIGAWSGEAIRISDAPRRPSPTRSRASPLRFEDQPDGSVLVRRADDGALIYRVAPETNGFMRQTLRGLARDRRRSGLRRRDAVRSHLLERRHADARRSGDRTARGARSLRRNQRGRLRATASRRPEGSDEPSRISAKTDFRGARASSRSSDRRRRSRPMSSSTATTISARATRCWFGTRRPTRPLASALRSGA